MPKKGGNENKLINRKATRRQTSRTNNKTSCYLQSVITCEMKPSCSSLFHRVVVAKLLFLVDVRGLSATSPATNVISSNALV